MKFSIIFQKAKRKLWFKLVHHTRTKTISPFIYASYWHSLWCKTGKEPNTTCYFTARPNPGAGIGHQLANWIAGYWWAKQFGLTFAHLPFSNAKWETLLGFGEGEATVADLKHQGYTVRRLPLFDEANPREVERVKGIIQSYAGKKVVFVAEQDQFYHDQFGVMADLQRKFNTAPSRKFDKVIYNPGQFNIAVHVRRTVVIDGKTTLESDDAKALRWLKNDYYETVLKQTLEHIHPSKPVSIYIFSTGKPEEFAEFQQYGQVRFCSDMDEYTTFVHLVKADLLITSKSSFSYKPALMNQGFKICPRNFWHGYPESENWILAENDGTFEVNKLENIK